MDTNDTATAQKVIRINENGIGFSQTGINGPYTNAWTIDGALNADFITTGTMEANHIKGGTLTLGGGGNDNGVCSVVNGSNQEKVRLDVNGITATAGTISGFTVGIDDVTNSAELKYTYDGTHWIRLAGGSWGGGLTMGGGSGKTTRIDGTEIYTTGNIYGNKYYANNTEGQTGSISWIDENQRKAFGLGVTNGIVTYISSSDY